MNIDIGKEYVTSDGREVRIYAVGVGASGERVHGAVLIDGCWIQREWGMNGNVYRVETSSTDLAEKP